ncbi:hypothetical protein ACFGVR_14515 [Mucilaginibacter sp. AW1-3]
MLFTGAYTYGTPVDLRNAHYEKKSNTAIVSVSKKTNRDAFDAFLNCSSAAQVTTQNFKQAHAYKIILTLSARVVTSINFLSLYTGSHASGLARFYKLILFPFHAFW